VDIYFDSCCLTFLGIQADRLILGKLISFELLVFMVIARSLRCRADDWGDQRQGNSSAVSKLATLVSLSRQILCTTVDLSLVGINLGGAG